MFKKTPCSCWFPGEVVNSCKEPRSLVVSDSSGSLYRRSLEHIKKTPDNNKENNITEESSGDIEINENNDRPERKNEIINNNVKKNNEQNQQYVSRSGRIIKQPLKLDL